MLCGMIRGGENLSYGFLAGAMTAKFLESFCNITIPSFFLLTVAVVLFAAVFRFCMKIPIVSSKVQRWVFSGTVILFFFICGIMNDSRCHFKSRDEGEGKIEKIISATREKAIERTKSMFSSSQQGSVAVALTIGEQKEIPPQLKKAYSESGTLHALALSGMHISIIYNMISSMLIILNISYRGRWVKLILAFMLIIFYSMMTGFSASIQRAAVMIFIYKAVEMSGRFRGRWSALSFAAAVIIIINPEMLATVSFQLSFAAVVGIIAVYPPMYKSLEGLFGRSRVYKVISPVTNMLCMSVACQITTTPFTWFYFRSYPELFLIANLVAVPLVTVAIYIYPLAFVFTYFNGIGNYPAAILEFVLRILNEAIMYIGK